MSRSGGSEDTSSGKIMFTYINPEIRERLIRDGKLLRIDSEGTPVEMLSLIHI